MGSVLFLMFMGTIILFAFIANHKNKKASKKYGEYLLQLEEVKQRKRERNGN